MHSVKRFDLIPEAVYQVTSVTPKRSRSYDTPLGVFSYRTVPARPARAGVEMIDIGGVGWAFVASPLRAVADLVYLAKRGEVEVGWDPVFGGVDANREREDLADLSMDRFDEVFGAIHDQRTRTYLLGMRQERQGAME